MVRHFFVLLLIVSAGAIRDTEDADETDSVIAKLNKRSEASNMIEPHYSKEVEGKELGISVEDVPGRSSLSKRTPSALVFKDEHETSLDKTVSKKVMDECCTNEGCIESSLDTLAGKPRPKKNRVCQRLAKVYIGGTHHPATNRDYCEAGFWPCTRFQAYLKDIPVKVNMRTEFSGTPKQIVETLMRRAEPDERGRNNMEISCIRPEFDDEGTGYIGVRDIYLSISDVSGATDVGKVVQKMFTSKFSGVIAGTTILAELPQIMKLAHSAVGTASDKDSYGLTLESVTKMVESITEPTCDGSATEPCKGDMTKENIDFVFNEIAQGSVLSKFNRGLESVFASKKIIVKLSTDDPEAHHMDIDIWEMTLKGPKKRTVKPIYLNFICKEEEVVLKEGEAHPSRVGDKFLRGRVYWPLATHGKQALTASDVKVTAGHLAGLVAMLTARSPPSA